VGECSISDTKVSSVQGADNDRIWVREWLWSG